MKRQKEKADIFRQLHHQGGFILPNAWNGGSAKTFEKIGFQAIGTTSAGISYAMGRSDGGTISIHELIGVVKQIIEVTELPVTVDMERGFSENPCEVASHVKRIIELGAVGINIEDGMANIGKVDDIDAFTAKISAVHALKESLGLDFFINARLDTFLIYGKGYGDIDQLIHRAHAAIAAGADGIFIPGPLDLPLIKTLKARIDAPLNLYLHPMYKDINALKDLGVERISSGSALARLVMGNLIKGSEQLLKGDPTLSLDHDFNYLKANTWFK